MAENNQEILAALVEIVSDETDLPAEQITAEKSFTDDLDIDSLSMMTITALAEEHFDIRIPEETATSFNTVGDVVTYIAGEVKDK